MLVREPGRPSPYVAKISNGACGPRIPVFWTSRVTHRIVSLAVLGVSLASGCGSDTHKGATDGGTAPFDCTSSADLHGFTRCDEGWMHRPSVEGCAAYVARSDYTCEPGGGECTTDSDCTELPYGRCEVQSQTLCTCQYGCVEDADCGPGQICMCIGTSGSCVDAACSSDADCAPGYLCSSYESGYCGHVVGFACQSAQDACASEGDCEGPSEGGIGSPFQGCQLDESGSRVCAACGIPSP